MCRSVLLVLFLFAAMTSFCQTGKDTVVYNLPVVNGKLIYTGSVDLKNRNKMSIDTAAKNWLLEYFKDDYLKWYPTNLPKNDTDYITLRRGFFPYYARPGYINIRFYAILNLKISVVANKYIYRIDSIYFRPQNNMLNALGYENDPEYLINLYKKKHLGLFTSMSLDRNMIRKYLSALNKAILDCITSLNKAVAN